MKKPIKISLFAVLFAIIALPVVAQQGGTTSDPGQANGVVTQAHNVSVTPDFEKKIWCEVVHKSYLYYNSELNKLNDAERDRVITRLSEIGFKLKTSTTTPVEYGDNNQTLVQTNYFFERATISELPKAQ